jgi:hypothetical protein
MTGAGGFNNPILGGTALIRPSIHSPDYVAGSTGWTVNQDGTAEFNGVTIRGKVVLGNGTTNTIVLDNTLDAILVYDSSGHLIASVSPSGGTDSFGNVFQAGVVSYQGGNVKIYSQLIAGYLAIATGDTNGDAFQIFTSGAVGGPNSDQPYAVLISPADSGIPTPITSQIEMYGEDAAQAREPFIRSRQAGLLVDMDWLHQGEIKYSAPGALNYGETWHAMALNANWAALGAPWGTPAYRKTPIGTVQFSGAVQWTDGVAGAPQQITTLPAGYRPPSQKHVFTMTMPGPAATPQLESLEVRTDGTVWLTNYPAGGPNTPITLDGAWFVLGN